MEWRMDSPRYLVAVLSPSYVQRKCQNLNKADKAPPIVSSFDKDAGLVSYEGSRHQYEWPMKKGYFKYLSRGLKVCCTGTDLTVDQVTWKAAPGKPFPLPLDYGAEALQRLNTFYDILHPAIKHKTLFKDKSESDLLAVRRETEFSVVLVLFTMNRLESFKRLV